MARLEILAPFILSWEGGYVNDPLDRGGATNMGVTLGTWQGVGTDLDGDGDIDTDDLRRLTVGDVTELVLRPHYWDRCKASSIRSQSIANIIVDWVWASGPKAIKQVQRLLGLHPDGIVGPLTLQSINGANSRELFALLHRARLDWIEAIVKNNPSQRRFLKGWCRRLESIGFGRLVPNAPDAVPITWAER